MIITKQHRKKIKAILFWYQKVARNLTLGQRLNLLRMWIDTCVEFEEYELAMALRKARSNLIKSIKIARKGQRTVLHDIWLHIRLLFRKIKRSKFISRLFSRQQ